MNSKTFHSIRTTCATLIQAAGVSEGVAMKLVGHDRATIHAGYMRIDVGQLRKVAESLEEL